MRQWWLQLWGYKLIKKRPVRLTWSKDITVGYQTELLYEKQTKCGPRYKVTKIKGAWE